MDFKYKELDILNEYKTTTREEQQPKGKTKIEKYKKQKILNISHIEKPRNLRIENWFIKLG